MTAPNPAAHTRRINERRPIVPPRIVRPGTKRRRARSNATEEDLQATQLRNIEQFASDDDENLIDDTGDGGEILDSPSLQPNSQEVSQTTSRSSSIGGQARKLQSDIWNYYTLIDSSSMKCNYCLTTYRTRGGTHAPRNHLLQKHKIDSANRLTIATAQYEERIEVALLRLPEEEKERKDRQFLKEATSRLSKQHLEYLYLKWTVMADVEFSQIYNKDFRTFLHYINQPANKMLPSSDTTIRTRVMLLFQEGQQRLRYLLQSAASSIHLTCDAWTSSNSLALLGVVSHFVDESGALRTLLLALKELEGEHSGENMAIIILDVLSTYAIRNRLGYFVMDNATNNDTMVEAIARNFQEIDGVRYDPIEHRLRCIGHIINLSVQAFLFGRHPDVEGNHHGGEGEGEGPSDKELQDYRKLGPQGKLHNIIVYIMRSPQRIQKFRRLSKGLMPKRDHRVRWNSWYIMLDWSIDRIKPFLQSYIGDDPDLSNDILTASDWRTLTSMRDFLQPFFQITKYTEGRNATINRVLPSLDFLLDRYELGALSHTTDDFMKLSIDAGWKKLKEYWNKDVNRASIYIAAIALDPTRKMSYFTAHWQQDWIDQAKQQLQELWRTYFNTPTSTRPLPDAVIEEPEAPEFLRWMNATQPVTAVDELEQYLNEPLVYGRINIITWWGGQRGRLPMLTRMAMDTFSIPAMSSEPERIFSSTKHIISDERASLKADTVEALECVKHWMQAGIYTDEDLNAVMAAEVQEDEDI